MQVIKTTEPAQWMIAEQTQAIMNALNSNAQNALFVGGCVRNMLLNEPVDDIDIATKHMPQQVIDILGAQGIKTIPTGIDHGTITAIIDDHKFEITTLRKDVETDGRRAVVAFSKDWSEDAERRDFTMNTLLADTNGNIYDPTGRGISDLENRTLIFVGNPEQRIREDYLRILRFFRFHALYGGGEPDATALKACKKYADQIKTLSRERVTQEVFKTLTAKHPDSIFKIMFENNVLREFADSDLELLKHLTTFQDRYGLSALSSRLWVFRNATNYLLIPKVFQRDMRDISSILNLPNLDNDHAVKIAVYKHGRTNAAQALMIEIATDRVINGYAPQALDIIQNWKIPTFPTTGEDLIAQGFKPGPELGAELQRLEGEWLKGL